MSVPVKVCGVTRPEDAALAAQLGAWAVGLVFHPDSPRRVTLAQGRAVCAALPRGVKRVGVFMDQELEEIVEAQRALSLDLIQLHGAEGRGLREELGVERCIKSVLLGDETAVERAAREPAGWLLVDRPRTPEAGAGPRPDAALTRKLAARRPKTLLAGGLTPENAAAAWAEARPWGLDVSSGVESAPGVKDPAKLRAFFGALA